MPADDPALIDIREFVEQQSRERYRAFVVHGRPLTGKSQFARKLAEISPGGVYLDVLGYVVERPELAAKIDVLGAKDLKQIVVAHAQETGAPLLIVDEFDFLIHVWGDDLTEFHRVVEKLQKMDDFQTVVGFVLQTLPALEQWRLENQNTGRSRILKLEEIKGI